MRVFEHIGKRHSQFTCDKHRKDLELSIDPFNRQSIESIRYYRDGRITSHNKNIRKDLEETLNLNFNEEDSFLLKNRKDAWEVCEKKLIRLQKSGNWKRKNLELMLKQYEQIDSKGQIKPYSGIVVYYLKKRLKRC